MQEKNQSAVLAYALELAGSRTIRYEVMHDGTDGYTFHQAEDDSFAVTAGSGRGVLYAVYDILDGQTSGGGRPAFSIRGINPCESLARHTPEQLTKLIDRMGRWRMNRIIIHSQYGFDEHRALIERETAKRGIEIVHYTYYNLAFCEGIPTKHFAKRKDGAPKPKGTRLECYDRLCASDPEGLALYAEGVERYMKAHPDFRHQMLATADGYDYCECEACRGKNPIAQWEPFFNRFFDHAPDRSREALIYVNRFSVPDDLTRIRRLDGVMFDTHLRVRRDPLRQGVRRGFPRTVDEEVVDPRAAGIPFNRYLFERLKEWRAAYPGNLYVFENLMVQGLFGLALPNVSVYLDDIRAFYLEGIDGVVYEAYETGIRYFLPHLERIALALWNPELPYEPDDFETTYLNDLESPEWPGDVYWNDYLKKLPEPEIYRLGANYKSSPSWANCLALLQAILTREDRDRFDWLYIGFTTMHYLHTQVAPVPNPDPLEELFLTTHKVWDFMNKVEKPRETAGAVIERLVERLSRGAG
jgi:hypothetical protein